MWISQIKSQVTGGINPIIPFGLRWKSQQADEVF